MMVRAWRAAAEAAPCWCGSQAGAASDGGGRARRGLATCAAVCPRAWAAPPSGCCCCAAPAPSAPIGPRAPQRLLHPGTRHAHPHSMVVPWCEVSSWPLRWTVEGVDRHGMRGRRPARGQLGPGRRCAHACRGAEISAAPYPGTPPGPRCRRACWSNGNALDSHSSRMLVTNARGVLAPCASIRYPQPHRSYGCAPPPANPLAYEPNQCRGCRRLNAGAGAKGAIRPMPIIRELGVCRSLAAYQLGGTRVRPRRGEQPRPRVMQRSRRVRVQCAGSPVYATLRRGLGAQASRARRGTCVAESTRGVVWNVAWRREGTSTARTDGEPWGVQTRAVAAGETPTEAETPAKGAFHLHFGAGRLGMGLVFPAMRCVRLLLRGYNPGFCLRRWRAAERRHPTGRERMGSPTLRTLQDPILLLPWLCFRVAAFQTPNGAPSESFLGLLGH